MANRQPDDIQPWPTESSEALGHFKVFSIKGYQRRSPVKGTLHTFYGIESSDWINIVAVTADTEEIIVVHQFRHGDQSITAEVPGGMVDPGEDAAAAALRELREETGYAAESAIQIGQVAPNPALFNNRCHTFLATGAVKVGEQEFDGTEDIAISTHPLSELLSWVDTQKITHALTINALFFYVRHLSLNSTPDS